MLKPTWRPSKPNSRTINSWVPGASALQLIPSMADSVCRHADQSPASLSSHTAKPQLSHTVCVHAKRALIHIPSHWPSSHHPLLQSAWTGHISVPQCLYYWSNYWDYKQVCQGHRFEIPKRPEQSVIWTDLLFWSGFRSLVFLKTEAAGVRFQCVSFLNRRCAPWVKWTVGVKYSRSWRCWSLTVSHSDNVVI